MVAWGAGALRGDDTGVSGARGHAQGPPDALRARTRSVTAYQQVCVFITAVPNTKVFAGGEEDSGGHVL